MKLKEILSRIVIPAYIGQIGVNIIVHYNNYADAREELAKDCYGPNLRDAWNSYAELEKQRIIDPRIFIPLSSIADYNFKPLRIRINGDLPELKIDIYDGINQKENSSNKEIKKT